MHPLRPWWQVPIHSNVSPSGIVVKAMTYEEVEPAALTVVLALGPKLMKKCAIERKLPVKAREQYSPGEVSELCAHAIKVIHRSGLKFDQVRRALDLWRRSCRRFDV